MTTPEVKPSVNPSVSPSRPAAAPLAADAPAGWWRQPRWWLAALVLVLLAVALTVWRSRGAAEQSAGFRTEPVRRGDLVLSVTANGTLQPVRSVTIGSELSGIVTRVLVDVNDTVKAGQLLLELDTAKLSDQVERSRAALAAAHAEVAQAEATASESRSSLARLEEVARLSGGKVPSKAELDAARAVLARAGAALDSARANVASATAALSTDRTNLAKAAIRSPIDGVVLTRSVEPGNAVAASLQAVTLLTVAQDLRQLRLQVNVDEADVGVIRMGQPARFTVSAYPARQYPANITRIAYGSTMTDNVVTYVTWLEVDNTDLSLRPGMTATATIRASARSQVLLVPNSALRFTPSSQPKAEAKPGIVASLLPRMPGRAPRKAGTAAGGGGGAEQAHQIWILRNGAPEAISIVTGISDGRMTEVTGGALQEGMQVITDQRAAAQ